MRMIIMAVLLLAVLGGGGAGVYFYFFNVAEASISEEDKEKATKEAKKEDHGGEHGAEAMFVELDPLILPIVDNDGIQQVVSIVIALEVSGPTDADKVKSLKPRLKDAYIQDLYGVLNKHEALKGGVVQVGPIKERLNMATRKVMGDDVVHDVLLQVVQQRPI